MKWINKLEYQTRDKNMSGTHKLILFIIMIGLVVGFRLLYGY